MSGAGRHTLGRWIRDRARATPERIAIDYEDRLVTYGELDAGSDAFAASFHDAGLRRGDRVATLTGNTPEHVQVFFACAKAGLILVPLSWRLTAPELQYQLADAEPALFLVEDDFRELAQQTSWPFERPVPGTAAPNQAPDVDVSDEDGLLLIYTSGTTGKPKGALLTHANCFWTNLSLDLVTPMAEDDVVLQVLPQFHCGGWNVQPLLGWWKGARVVLERGFDAGRVLELIERKRVTTLMGVPAIYLFLAQHPRFAEADLSSLRRAVVGVPDERWGEVGAAYVVADRVSADELLAWCEARLARFKVPKSIDLVAEIPRNGMGKVQKQELGQRELAR